MEKNVTNLEDITAPLNNGCSPPRLANYYTQCDVRRTAQSLLNKGSWLDSNEYHFLSHIDSLWTEYDDWQKSRDEESAERCLKHMSFAINGLRDLYIDYRVRMDEFKPKDIQQTDLVMEHPKMSRNYIRVANEIDEIPTQRQIGLTHNDDDLKESESCQTTPLYYHPEEKS